jgi:hypothetical protein
MRRERRIFTHLEFIYAKLLHSSVSVNPSLIKIILNRDAAIFVSNLYSIPDPGFRRKEIAGALI